MLSHAGLPMAYTKVTDRLQMYFLEGENTTGKHKQWFIATLLRRRLRVGLLPLFVDHGDERKKNLVDDFGVLVEVMKAFGKPEGTHLMASPPSNLHT